MPCAKNADINIYYEVEGEGPPLVMLHGLTASLDGWKETGFVDALIDDYRVIRRLKKPANCFLTLLSFLSPVLTTYRQAAVAI